MASVHSSRDARSSAQRRRCRDVQHAARILVVEMKLARGHRLQRLQESHVAARAAGIVELEGAAAFGEPLHHAPDRGNTNAAGEQDAVLGILRQREIVARPSDLERLADAHVVVHAARAAAACRVALDRDGVGRRRWLGLDQRVLPDQPVRQMQVEMRAGLVGRQRLAVGRRELIDIGVACRIADRGHPQLDQALGRPCRRLGGTGRAVFTNASPALAPASSSTVPGLSNMLSSLVE